MTIGTWKDCEILLYRLAREELAITEAETKMNAEIESVKEKFTTLTEDNRAEASSIRAAVEAYCNINKNEFQKRRSKEFPIAILSFRTTPPKVLIHSRKYNIKTAIELLKKLFKNRYIRVKEEIDKDLIITDYSAKKLTDEKLTAVGLRIDQAEKFDIKIKFEELQPHEEVR